MGELVRQAEIARRLGLTRQRVSRLAMDFRNFPAVRSTDPYGGTVKYDWSEVEAWNKQRVSAGQGVRKESCAKSLTS